MRRFLSKSTGSQGILWDITQIRSFRGSIMDIIRRQSDISMEKIMLDSAVAVLVLLGVIAPAVMATQGYWTSNDSYPPKGLKKYHIFLDGTYPSYVDRSYRLVNQNLTTCLDFNPNYTNPNPKPLVCHPIKGR